MPVMLSIDSEILESVPKTSCADFSGQGIRQSPVSEHYRRYLNNMVILSTQGQQHCILSPRGKIIAWLADGWLTGPAWLHLDSTNLTSRSLSIDSPTSLCEEPHFTLYYFLGHPNPSSEGQ